MSDSLSENPQRFSSRWALILSVLGIAVGTGNIWRFPRIAASTAGEEGAGAFLIAWISFLFLWSIPLIIAEYSMGKKSRLGVPGAFGFLAGKKYTWMGAFVGFVAAAIMFYYSVVAGWCMFYFYTAVSSDLPTNTVTSTAIWENFQSSGFPVFFHALAMGLGVLACIKGIKSIEKVNKVLVPTLIGIVIIALVRALSLPGSMEGIKFLFTPQWSQLGQPEIWLQALTQNAWDTGAGWGLILTYATYMRMKDGVVKNSFLTAIGNNLVSLMAAVMVFGTVFAILGVSMTKPEILEIMKDSGPASTGLTFIWMPQLFEQMLGGKILALLFFLGLSFAALSSLISMIELSGRPFIDAGIDRKKTIILVGVIGFALGIPSAVNLNFLANQDFVWGVALMISGALVAFALAKYGAEKLQAEASEGVEGDWKAGPFWLFVMKFLIPLQAVVLLVWWMALSATSYAPDDWYNPFNAFSVMTCLVQWAIAGLVFFVFNSKMNKSLFGKTT